MDTHKGQTKYSITLNNDTSDIVKIHVLNRGMFQEDGVLKKKLSWILLAKIFMELANMKQRKCMMKQSTQK